MKGLWNWYLPLGSVHRRWTGLFLFSTILLVLGLAAPAAAQMPPSCTETDAAITTTIERLGLPDTTDATNLVADCTTLLRLKDELRGTGSGSLNWDTTIPMWSGVQSITPWDGILVSSSGPDSSVGGHCSRTRAWTAISRRPWLTSAA